MSQPIPPIEAKRNEAILARVEGLGGGYVWDAQVFAVICMDHAIADADAMALAGLTGVQQIALDASRVSVDALKKIAAIQGLQSLLVSKPAFSADELQMLRAVGPDVQVIEA
jgi:hypothetical protein